LEKKVLQKTVLKGKNVLLGVTGSIAAYKSVDLVRRLKEEGAEVSVVMTKAACNFISPLVFEVASQGRVYTDIFTDPLSHISLPEKTSIFVIAPATANIINKISCGIADDILSTIWLAYKGPAVIAPAMNWRMYENPIVEKNIKALKARGVNFVGPEIGSLACGDEKIGRMSEVTGIVEAMVSALSTKDLSGQTVLVTAGSTREPIDPIRFISNRSSGKMGFALAQVALRRGAKVILISGPTSLIPPRDALFTSVERTEDMRDAVIRHFKVSDIVIMAAAVSDFCLATESNTKIKKRDTLSLSLKRTPDILSELGKKKGRRTLVGFSAETGKAIDEARGKLLSKNLDLIVLNDVTEKGAGFDSDTNIVTTIDKRGDVVNYPIMTKVEVADIIFDRIIQLKA